MLTIKRINCNGDYTDTLGNFWENDEPYSTNSVWNHTEFNKEILNTNEDFLYQSQRYGGEFNIPVPNGNYKIKLYFADIFANAPGERVFSVFVNEAIAFPQLDLLAIAPKETAIVKVTQPIEITNGNIRIHFQNFVDVACISAIEILSTGIPLKFSIEWLKKPQANPLAIKEAQEMQIIDASNANRLKLYYALAAEPNKPLEQIAEDWEIKDLLASLLELEKVKAIKIYLGRAEFIEPQ